jgi:AraC family L-rhamnose operon transcriptional activator RhaR
VAADLPTAGQYRLFARGPIWGGVHHLDGGVASHAHDFVELAVVGPGDGRHVTAGSAMHRAVAETVARLESDPAEEWRLDDLARAASIDPAYLGRLFVRYTGLTPMNFLARVRAERAATLLAHSTLSAAQVGAAVGWDDPTYFARRFRTLVGLTPSEYRRRTRAG